MANAHRRRNFLQSLSINGRRLNKEVELNEDLKDLRPISLVGGLYKILTKVLANRIKRVMGKIISQSQSALLKEDIS